MKNYLITLFCLCLLSCGGSKNGLILKRDDVSIAEKGISFHGIVPMVNQTELKRTGSDQEGKNTIIHYKHTDGEKKIDLVFRTTLNDSLLLYQISARLPDKMEWLPTDTLKVLFETSDSIKAGIYSMLYSSVFCWTKPVRFTNFKRIGKVQGIQFAYWKYNNDVYAAAIPFG